MEISCNITYANVFLRTLEGRTTLVFVIQDHLILVPKVTPKLFVKHD